MTCHRFLPVAALALLAAGCGDKSKPQEGGLQGEVLEGTISDDMIPLDQVKSQAPLAGDTGDGGAGDARSGDAPEGNGRTGDQAAEVDAAQPTPVPAETPVTTTDGQTG